MESLKPIKRSPVRIYFGTKYYRMKRYMDWYFGNTKYALTQAEELLQHVMSTSFLASS